MNEFWSFSTASVHASTDGGSINQWF